MAGVSRRRCDGSLEADAHTACAGIPLHTCPCPYSQQCVIEEISGQILYGGASQRIAGQEPTLLIPFLVLKPISSEQRPLWAGESS